MQKVGYKVGYKKPINLECFKKLNFIFGRVQTFTKGFDAFKITGSDSNTKWHFF